MTAHLYLAPAAAGKTAYAIQLARQAAQGLQAEVRVCVASMLQVQSWQRRLAQSGGALGVRVMTFDELYEVCLNAAGESYTRLGTAVQVRLIRTIVDELPLVHYQSLRDQPGFILVLQSFILELKGARIAPERYLKAVDELGDMPRLRELGQIYAAYQDRLLAQDWVDYAGIGWLAIEALEGRAPDVARDWPLLIVDGFDSFTELQLDLLQLLAGRVGSMAITLTGDPGGGRRIVDEQRPVHGRFHRACQRLEQRLGIRAKPLPEQPASPSPVLAHLEVNLFADAPPQIDAAGAVTLIEAPNSATEARAALRWLKERLVRDGLHPGQVALLARDLTPYRPFIVQTAAEFGIPIRLLDGLPLRSNPAIAALLDILRLVLPGEGAASEPALPRQGVVAAWRSPYFDWATALLSESSPELGGITPKDADNLDAAARWGRVIGGYSHWQELFSALAGRDNLAALDDEQRLPGNVVIGPEAQALESKFTGFLIRLMPPPGLQRYWDYVRWLEDLIGSDPNSRSPEERASLNMVAQIDRSGEPTAGLDRAALQSLKGILRGLVWAEQGLDGGQSVDFRTFFTDLTGAIEATTFQPPGIPGREGVLVASVARTRGVPFRAVALLGMAEGQFPATLVEDPFLREGDRQQLRDDFGLPLDSSIDSAEREFFYEAVTTPSERLLLTRPRLADTGAEWLASPFWEEIRRLVSVQPIELTTESLPSPEEVASWAELVESLVALPNHQAALSWAQAYRPGNWTALYNASRIFRERYNHAGSIFDGDLTGYATIFNTHFSPAYGWSPSALESYRACPFLFFTGRVLRLEPRVEPVEGLDAAQLGTIYHEILEALYESQDPADRTDADRLLTALPVIAQSILDGAPQRQGFRETAWWRQTKAEIQEKITQSVTALAQLGGDFTPLYFEARFFGSRSLAVREGGDYFRLHGIIDRIDRDPDGRLRVIDYKTAGPYSFSPQTLDRGEKLQLPLYTLAARDALALGEPVDGFYWHIRHAKPSDLQLAKYGLEEAIETAVDFAWRAVRGARQGDFTPKAPSDGCPGYCPAAAFCWHHKPGGWG